jgi:gluconolactonase
LKRESEGLAISIKGIKTMPTRPPQSTLYFGKIHLSSLFLFLLLPSLISGSVQAAETMADLVDSEVKELFQNLKFTEGPLWHPDGYLLFSDIPANRICKWTPDGKTSVFREPSSKSNGLTLDGQNRLVAAEQWERRVTVTQPDGKVECVAGMFEGKPFNSPNDVVVHSSGAFYFTDPSYGLEGRKQDQPVQGVYRVGKPGEAPRLVVKDSFKQPNGLAFSPDEKVLYVGDSEADFINAYDVQADGSLTNERRFCTIKNPDGMKVDQKGRLFTSSAEGISVFQPDGTLVGAIRFPQQPANCAFGGKDLKTLFVTARTGVYSVRLKTPGLPTGKRNP